MCCDRIVYPEALFRLMASLAAKASELARHKASPLSILSQYTPAMRCLGFGRDFENVSADWVNFAENAPIENELATTQYLYSEHLQRNGTSIAPVKFGYFWYEVQQGGILRVHFENDFRAPTSPLIDQRARREELRALMCSVRDEGLRPSRIMGRSWLYNRRSYQALFPPEYIALAQNLPTTFDLMRRMALWGQLLIFDGTVRQRTADYFRSALALARSTTDLVKCFELEVKQVAGNFDRVQDHFMKVGH